jgi:hypothetical protein
MKKVLAIRLKVVAIIIQINGTDITRLNEVDD